MLSRLGADLAPCPGDGVALEASQLLAAKDRLAPRGVARACDLGQEAAHFACVQAARDRREPARFRECRDQLRLGPARGADGPDAKLGQVGRRSSPVRAIGPARRGLPCARGTTPAEPGPRRSDPDAAGRARGRPEALPPWDRLTARAARARPWISGVAPCSARSSTTFRLAGSPSSISAPMAALRASCEVSFAAASSAISGCKRSDFPGTGGLGGQRASGAVVNVEQAAQPGQVAGRNDLAVPCGADQGAEEGGPARGRQLVLFGGQVEHQRQLGRAAE